MDRDAGLETVVKVSEDKALYSVDVDLNMTYYGHMRTINISQFKAHISRELRAVRQGERIVILDRDIPVAEVLPYRADQSLRVRPPEKKLTYPEVSFRTTVDPLQFLMEDRAKR